MFMATALAALAQYTIYPVPQSMTAKEGTAQFSENVCLVADEAIDAATIERARQVMADHGMTLSTTGGAQQCTSVIYLKVDPAVAQKGKFDAHRISLQAQGDGMASLTITGQHTDATFYGLATLEQMLDEKGRAALPCVEITDWADQQQRGLVEGYYGYPYSVAVKKDLMRYMMRLKMNTYLYGAKSDPYHSNNWKDAYPTSITPEQEVGGWLSQDMLRDLCQVSHDTKVNFIWAIHPGNSFVGSSTVVNDIMGKFQKMHDLGVRQFAVFVDDVGIPSTDADMKTNADHLTELQHTIEKTFNKAGTAPTDTVRPLHFVPQIYCRGFAGSQDQFDRFFRALSSTPSYITVYTTGGGVWSVPNVNDYNTTAVPLGREVAWWWNYPCNDNSDGQIYPMDMLQNFVDLPQINSSSVLPATLQGRGMGIVSNPMQQGEVAKTALFSVADYAWHCAGFKNKDSWEASFRFVLPDPTYAEAYRTLAPYLTNNDPTSGTSSLTANLTLGTAERRLTPLIEAAETLMGMAESERESDRLLYTDLKPWLLRLHGMLTVALDLYRVKSMPNTNEAGDLNAEKWQNYANALALLDEMEENTDDYYVKTLDGKNYQQISTKKVIPSNRTLAPAIATLKGTAIKGFVKARPAKPTFLTNTGTTTSVSTSTTDGAFYLNISQRTLNPGQYVGMTLTDTRRVELTLADTLLTNFELRTSADGKEWTTYDPAAGISSPIRHLILLGKANAPQSLRLNKAVLSVKTIENPTISSVSVPSGEEYGGHEKKYMTDGDYSTWFTMNANQKTDDTYVLNLSKEAPIRTVRVAIGTVNSDYMNTGRIEISTDGTNWKRLSPVGKAKTSFTISDMTKYSDECKILDFDGKEQMARYIRLYNQTANTSKWLRIFEIQPFYATTIPEVEDANGSDLTEAYDGDASTGIVPAGQTLIRLPQVENAESIVLLTSKGIEEIPMTDTPRDASYIYKWSGTAPKIYEVVVNSSETPYDITSVTRPLDGQLTTDNRQLTTPIYDLQGRLLRQPQSGLYIQRGLKIIR